MNRLTQVAIRALLVGVVGMCPVASAKDVAVMPPHAVSWVIESAEYTGKIADQIARLEAVLTIRVIQDGWVEVPLTLPGTTITKIELAQKSARTHIVPRGGQYVLTASRKGTYKVKIEFSTRLIQDSQHEGVAFGIPQATFSTLSLIVPRKDVELRESDQLYVERHPDGEANGVVLKAYLASANRVDVRWSTKPAIPVKVEPLLYGEVHTLAILEEQLARLSSIIDYRITQGELRELAVRLPKVFQVLNVRGAGIEEWRVTEQPDFNTLRVQLNFTLKDTSYRLVVEGEQALEAAQPTYQLPEVVLVGVKQERGQLAVATAGSLEVTAGALEGLTRLDVKEISEMLKTTTTFPILMAFRYHQHPYQAALTITRYQDLPVLNAIAEQGELITILSRQGELLTRAAYSIRANKKQFLGVLLPSGATLWSCIVDGRSVKPVEGTDGQQLVPLATTKGADQPILVELVYFEQRPTLGRLGQLKLNGPILDVPTTIANWFVYTPRQVKLLRTSGNLEKGASSFEFVEEPLTQVAEAPRSSGHFVERVARMGWKAQDKAQGPEKSNADLVGEKFSLDNYSDMKEARHEQTRKVYGFAGNVVGAATPEAPTFQAMIPSPAGTRDRQTHQFAEEMAERMQEAGIFPLKIRLPKAGTVHRFNRLMTTQEALELEAVFVNLPTVMWPLAGLGLLLISSSGFAVFRFWRP